jgi:hypothetical protein
MIVGMNLTKVHCKLYGTVIKNLFVQLLYGNKNVEHFEKKCSKGKHTNTNLKVYKTIQISTANV